MVLHKSLRVSGPNEGASINRARFGEKDCIDLKAGNMCTVHAQAFLILRRGIIKDLPFLKESNSEYKRVVSFIRTGHFINWVTWVASLTDEESE